MYSTCGMVCVFESHIEDYDRRNMALHACPQFNFQNLWKCYLCGKRNFADAIGLRFLRQGMTINFPCRSSIIRVVFKIKEKVEESKLKKRWNERSSDCLNTFHCWLWRTKKSQVKEWRQPLESRKGKKMDSALKFPGEKQSSQHLVFSSLKPTSDFWYPEI